MTQTIRIDSLDTAVFVCPECKKTKVLQLSSYRIEKRRTTVKCKCGCGHASNAILEKQYDHLGETCLLGTFMTRQKTRSKGKMIIKKLNSKGLMLRTNIEQNILPGLKLFLEFVLDDAKQSIVKKEVIVKARKGKYLSAEFTSEEHFDNLGPYLFFNKLNI
ncbi:MAG: hypothetical protein D3926_23685 [Desulfobacteraceae bacterium]|nr:MAG: hypothetical protein D3926_23685 [Desulfobacteraceae bacterium]